MRPPQRAMCHRVQVAESMPNPTERRMLGPVEALRKLRSELLTVFRRVIRQGGRTGPSGFLCGLLAQIVNPLLMRNEVTQGQPLGLAGVLHAKVHGTHRPHDLFQVFGHVTTKVSAAIRLDVIAKAFGSVA